MSLSSNANTRPAAAWVERIDLALASRRLGNEVVDRQLCAPRDYDEAPHVDASGRLAATLGRGPRLASPMRVALRLGTGDVFELACACKSRYVCDHIAALVVDVAAHDALRAAIAAGTPTEPLLADLAAIRQRTFEERTLAERLALWLPREEFEEDLEIDVEMARTHGLATPESRPVVLLRHRRSGSGRTVLKPRAVIEARLTPRHRRLVELTAPSSAQPNALVAVRAQASLLVHLLTDETARHDARVFTGSFKKRLRYAKSHVAPRLEPVGERLLARWYSADGELVADASDALLFAGPFPYLWVPASETFHPLAPSVDLDVAWGLSQVPSLPLTPSVSARIGRALLAKGRGLGVRLPSHEVFGLPPPEKPTFELDVTGSPLDLRLDLHAVYGTTRIKLADGSPADDDDDDDDAYRRDSRTEQRALSLVREAGFDEKLEATEERAVEFWQHGAHLLRTSIDPPFHIRIAESLGRVRFVEPVSVDVHVQASAGWLDTNFTFTAGALKVELRRMRAAVAREKRWMALADGTLTRITEEVRALVAGTGDLVDDGGEGRLAPHQLGRVEQWVRQFGGSFDPTVKALRTELEGLATQTEPAMPSDLRATLRPYQKRGLAWLQFLKRLGAGGVLADDMGLGKTITTLALLAWSKETHGPRPSLVVCPTSLVGNWVRETERFTPGLRVLVLHGSSRTDKIDELMAYDLVVTTYGVLRRDVGHLATMRFRCVVLDEAQNVKNASAATTRAAARLDADMRIALSGTPVENRLTELWSIMSFANPGMLGTASDFEERYETPISNFPDGTVAEELRGIVRPFVLRRTKAEVLSDLPPKTEVERPLVLGHRQKAHYDALAFAVREAVKTNIEKRGLARSRLSVLTAILRLRQMACDPRLVDPTLPATDSVKRAAFLELVRDLALEGRRALVFSQFVELLTLWRQDLDRMGIRYEYLDGASTDRDAIVERFQTGDARLFLLSLKAGGAGLNLTAADTVIHCDPWWNPAVEDQATDRAYRIGQTKPVTVIRLLTAGTIEEKVGLLKSKKREIADAIMGSDAEGLGTLDEDDLRGLLGDAEGDADTEADEELEIR
ncbi:Helicase, SNF2/RAD54 family [Labilithrix luteola]|uniref:Helicase, SNF2/RAD54 family n=1 Tax=Labilithrix luteola TaxID=1391654 RepID=A0A0K1QG62_9BACT|nr:DEAD/DEAH box helicase [Labilithrix luteola]AKV04749.1 Helicase, SNF2/RAD54 family [Labilithrix luteola]